MAVPARLALAFVAAMLTRYEAWPVVAAAIVAAIMPRHDWARRPRSRSGAAFDWRCGPAIAVALVLLNSRVTVGSWFVSSGFFVPDPGYQGRALRSLVAVWWGTHELSTRLTEIVAVATRGLPVLRSLTRSAEPR
jgi:hypothetical protein